MWSIEVDTTSIFLDWILALLCEFSELSFMKHIVQNFIVASVGLCFSAREGEGVSRSPHTSTDQGDYGPKVVRTAQAQAACVHASQL